MKSISKAPKVIKLEKPLPVISATINLMTQKTENEISQFDNISYNNNDYIINLVREEEKNQRLNNTTPIHHRITRRATQKNTQRTFFFDRAATMLNKTRETSHPKTKRLILLNQKDFMRRTTMNPTTRNTKKIATTYTNTPIKKQTLRLFNQCDEIENECFSLRTFNNSPDREERDLSKKFKTIERNSKRQEIEELRYDKGKIGVQPLMKLKLKNLRILQETDCVKKVSNTLAFKANKLINGLFTIQNKRLYFTKNYQNYQSIRIKRKQNIKVMDNMLNNNIKEHNKVCKIYNKYINTE